ncbi:hypothetical protein C943_04085 [Mariniradius saccharolyticus AK6]|uniref:Uncharacterized protein n=1 Tax=Mariniradius saccharolyticus AK6 TaxID=1239962 RepID=M7Y0K7_9BACT|nr:hypothetical protein C943_04085 [Mariniradius saccharolyticus AK6]
MAESLQDDADLILVQNESFLHGEALAANIGRKGKVELLSDSRN